MESNAIRRNAIRSYKAVGMSSIRRDKAIRGNSVQMDKARRAGKLSSSNNVSRAKTDKLTEHARSVTPLTDCEQ